MKKNKKKYIWDEIRGIYTVAKRRRSSFILRIILIVAVLSVAILNILNRYYENFMVCMYALMLFMLPPFVEKKFGMTLPEPLEIVVLLFVFAAEIIGEIQGAYLNIPGWDIMLHAINGFCCAAIGFALLDMFNRNREFKFQLSPLYLALVAFCFSMTIGVLWEFFEFLSDIILHTDMQKDTWIHAIHSVDLNPFATSKSTGGHVTEILETWVRTSDGQFFKINPDGKTGYLDVGIVDTMKDMMVNFVGAAAFSVIGYFYVKTRNLKFAEYFIPVIQSKDEMIENKKWLDEKLNSRNVKKTNKKEKSKSVSPKPEEETADDDSAKPAQSETSDK